MSCSSYDKPTKPKIFGWTPAPCETIKETPLPNPKPENYIILNYYIEGRFLLLLVNYPDCKNYEGNKILLYENTDLEDIKRQGSIDPHFSNNIKKHSPIARFVPTLTGWDMAQKLIRVLKHI